MREIKDYIWIAILVGGILALVSIFTPLSYYISASFQGFNWMWGLSYTNSAMFGSQFYFRPIENPILYNIPIFISGLIPAILILVSSLKLIIMANRLRTGSAYIKDIEKNVIKWGVMSILSPIIYVIALNITLNTLYAIEGYPPSFFFIGTNNLGFAFIGPFIGGSIALISGIVSKTKIPRELGITKMPSQPMTNRASSYTKYIWIIGLTGGIIALISLLTPSFYSDLPSVKQYYWLWGLVYSYLEGVGSNFAFLPTESPLLYMMPIFLAGLIPAILILVSSVKIITITNEIRNGYENLKFAANKIIGWGIALLLAPIIFVIALDITMGALIRLIFSDPLFPTYGLPGIWDVYQPGFAVSGPIIGAILIIISGIAGKIIQPKKIPLVREDFKKPIPEVPTTEKTIHAKFCPDCGKQLLRKQDRYCSNCGFEINIVM